MTKMVRLPVGGDQEQPPPDLTAGNGIQGENICTEIPSLRESAPKPTTIKLQESSTKTTPTEADVLEQDLQNQRRTSHRLLTANRNDTVGTTSTLSSSRPINGQGMGSTRNSEQRMSATSDPSTTSIICSLPLNRLESILGMLNVMKKSQDHTVDLAPTDAVSREEDQNNSSPAGSDSTHDATNDNSSSNKVLCLYCDRSFSSQKLMIKHTDRIHRIAKDRRSSARVLSTALNGSDVSACCHFCHKSKTLNLVSENLPELFKHLISVHSDRYYACEHCTVRFPNDEAREAHMEALHPSINSGRPKSKAALKAFSHGQNNCTLHHPQPVVSVVNCKTFKTAGVSPEGTEPLSMPLELSSRSMDRLVLNNRVSSNSTKGESAVQNICLRSSLRNAAALATEKGAEGGKSKTKAFKKSERLLRRNSEPMLLSRLGITQHRLPRQSRRLLAAASTTANASLLSSDTSSASSASSTSSVIASCLGKFTAKKKGLILSNDEVQPVQNCYNKITKLKTIRSTLSTNSMVPIADGTVVETTDTAKAPGKGSDGTANGSASVTSTGPTIDITGGLNNRGAMNNSSLAGNSIWCNSAGSVSCNASNGNATLLAASSGVFDEDFYETVTQNVKNNLSCHLDGKLEASTPYAPSPMSPVSVVPAVRSTVVKSPVSTDSKIHEATNLPAVSVMFPTLLTVEQYGTEPKPTTSTAAVASVASTSSVKTKKPVTKNSWKWKWDFVKKYKYVNENGRIVKKIKQPTIGLRDLSKLDMWTQLTMRTKHELFQHRRSSDDHRQIHAPLAPQSDPSAKAEPMAIADVGATLRHEKRAMVEQLDDILDARLLPHIDLEQNDQRIIKLEPSDEHITKEETTSISTEPIDDKNEINVPSVQSSSLVPWSNHLNTHAMSKDANFLHNLQLIQLNRHAQNSSVVLSGEWARPRCYICYGCGAKFNSLKQVEEHRVFRHPHVHSTFYEIVGRELIEKRLYKHFFIPVIALMMHRMHCMRLGNPERILNSAIMHGMNPQHAGVCRMNTVAEIKNEDSSSNEATSFSTSTSASSSSSSRHSTNTTVTTLMDTCSDAINVLTHCSALAIEDEDEGTSNRTVICSKCQKECQNQIVLYAHILHCSNDYVWLQAKKRLKYRRAKRRRGGNRSSASCAPTILTMPRMVQPLHNVVEKVESAGYVPLSLPVDDKHDLNGVAVSNTSLNNISLSSNVSSSSDSTCGSSSTSNNSSINSNDLSKVNASQKVRRSPKPKENDSDIVKKLLANLPAKRNSRQTNSPTSKQINKRTRVVGRKNFGATTVSITSKQRGHGTKRSSLLLGESTAAQPTPNNTAPVHNGNDNDSNKNLSTSLISSTKRETISHSTAATKLRTRQGLSSSATSALHGSSNKAQKVTCKKISASSEDTDGDANCKRSSKESAHIVEKGPQIRKKDNRGKLVGTIGKNKILMWKKGQKHQLVRVTTTNGHHRMLRSSGKRLLPVSVSIRQPCLPLRSFRHSTRGKNVLNKRKMLTKHKPMPSVATFQDETLYEKESTTIGGKDDAGKDAAEVACEGSIEQIPSNKVDSSLETEALAKGTADNSTESETAEKSIVAIDIEQAVDNMESQAGSIKTPFELLAFPHGATQVTPNQPIKKQYSKDPPATPTKCDPTPVENAQHPLSSYSAVVEPNEPLGTSGGQLAGGCKPRKKKLNDCIAMLTGKLSERLGVDFFNNEKNIEESPQTESSVSCSTSEPEKIAAHNTTTRSCSVSSEECLNFTKHKEVTPVNVANAPKHSLLPAVATNNNSNTSSSMMSAQSDILPVSSTTSTPWSNEYRQALTVLPQPTAPIRLKTVNSVRSVSPNLATPTAFERSATQIESTTEQIPDEPLNLSKNSPIGRGVIRNAKPQWKQDNASNSVFKSLQTHQESSILANSSSTQPLHAHYLKAEKPATHFNHLLGTSTHANEQKARKTKCMSPPMTESGCSMAPKMGASNFSSLKLPPGLIIERVEYKQSRPSITKEVPSVTIVARQRQLPAPELIPSGTENSATDLTIEKLTPLTHSSNLNAFANNSPNFVKPLTNNTSCLMHHSDPNHAKVLGYGNCSEPNVLPRRSEATTDNLVPMCTPTVLRSGPCAENRISVTITESNATIHERMQDFPIPSTSLDLSTTSQKDKMVSSYCSPLRKSPLDSVQMRAPQRASSSVTPTCLHKIPIGTTGHKPGSSEKTSPPMTTLIIPQVPMPPLSSQALHSIKRARRKSVFVPLPVPTDESNRDVMANPLRQQHSTIPTITAPPPSTLSGTAGITSANLLASMSLSFIAPGLLPVPGTSMLGPIDMQRLAAVRLPAHLQPPVIPPLKIPDAATSATLLEKIFHPTPSDTLSTALELKTGAHCNQTKQRAVIHSHMYHNTAEENSHFISTTTTKSPNINGFINQSEQISPINVPLPTIRTDGIRTTDTKVIKSNTSSSASKGSGRIMKRRASVADLQRKALMEQIWNQSIIDKMIHEKDARIVAGLEETPKAVDTTTTTTEIVIERNSDLEKIYERTTTRQAEHLTTIAERPNIHSTASSCAPNGNKTERQNEKECSLEIDLMSAKVMKIPENISKTIMHHDLEEQQKHSTVAIPLNVQEEKKTKLQNAQTECIVQLQSQHEDSTIALAHNVDKLNDSNTTLVEDQHTNESDPPVPLSTINPADMVKTVDKIDAASEDGSVDAVDCQASTDTQKTTSKKIVRKRRKNELASILSDQLLESFKEVDKSRLDDLKLLHDLTCETPDVKFTLEQIPQLAKRKSNPRMPELVMQESSKFPTSVNTTAKKVQNAKRQVKEKELTLQPTVKEAKIKSSNDIFGSCEPSPTKVKAVPTQDEKEDAILNDPEDECTQKATSETQEITGVQENLTELGLITPKTTRSKTQTTFNGEHISHNSPRKTSSRLPSSELNADVAANDRTDAINTQDRKGLLRKRATTPAAEILQSFEKINSTNRTDDIKTVNSITAGNARLTETVSDKCMDTSVLAKATSNVPKRIMSRRKSVFVDCDLAQYVEKEEEKLKKESTNVSFKDDLMLTPRRGTRSQGQLGLDLMESLVEATMKPRDPRRRMLQKRREEELSARENKLQLQIKSGSPAPVDTERTSGVVEKQMEVAGSNRADKKENKEVANEFGSLGSTKPKNDKETSFSTVTQEHAPLRRISARRASVCVRSLTDSKNVKACLGTITVLPEDDHLRDIGNEVKRIYKRRASIYQPPTELQQEDEDAGGKQTNHKESQALNSKMEEENTLLAKKKEMISQKSHNRRSKTPGPGDWKRRNQLPLNGTSEPLIESLLLHAPDSESNAPKRRTTKNSQIAETVSKLFNIQEEIMMIDSSRRKPRKVNLPTVSTQPETSIQEQQIHTLNSTNEGTGIEKGNEKSKALSTYNLPTVGNEVIEKKSPPQLPRKSFSFSNDEDESPKAIKKLVENIINNTTNSSNASTDYSDDDNMSLACFAARSNVPVASSLQATNMFAKPPSNTPARAMSVIADDESTTNTDALDDDMMSVTTEIPTSTNTRMGTRRVRRKRRKSSRQNSKIKRQQAKTQGENNKPVQSFNCSLCRKMFKKQDAYNKHRMTLSHIAKLSEQEYLVSQQNQKQQQDDSLHVSHENTQLQPKPDQERQDNKRTENIDEPNAKTIVAPEVLPATPDGSLPMASLSMVITDKTKLHDDQSVKELSQEEKLFFECCSMLKESNSSESDKIKRVTVSLKANELLNSTDSINPCVVLTNEANHVSATDHSVHLPLVEQNQTLPVSPTCCVEEFVATQVTDIHQEEANYPQHHGGLGEAANFMVQRYVVANDAGNVSPHNSIKSSSTMPTATTSSISSSSSSTSSLSSNSSSSDSNNVSKNNAINAKIKTKGALKGYDNFKVSIPMTGLTVMSTNTANTGVGVGKESRLDTLADVALCGDIPKEFGIAVESDEINAATIVRVEERADTCTDALARFPVAETDMFIDGKVLIHSLKLIENNEKDCISETKTNSSTTRASEQNNAKSMTSNKIGCARSRESSAKSQNKPSTRWITGPYRRRTEKNNPPPNAEATALQCDHTFLCEGDDVYAFQDSPCDADLPSTYSSKKNSNTMHNQSMMKNDEGGQQHIKHNATVTATLEEHEDSQMSSLSFSDRDDFVYGTNTMSEEEEEEEDKNSSISSEQTTPKKLTNADVQKKSLIMGRIFKKGGAKDKLIGEAGVRKCSTTSPEAPVTEVPQKIAGTAVVVSKPSTTVKSSVKDFDKLFDTLKNDAVSATELQNSDEPESYIRHTGSSGEEMLVAKMSVKDKLAEYQTNNADRPYHPGHKDFEKIDPGTERLRRRRTGQQKFLTETWDSDEFEDFQTDDIMRLIDRTEDDEANDNTLSKKRMPLHKTAEEQVKSGNVECIPADGIKQSSSLNDISNSEKEYHRIEQILDRHAGSKKGIHSLIDKKPSKSDTTVTDDTIRKVMESVILETMGKSCNTNKRKPATHVPTLGTDSTAASNSKALRFSSNSEDNGKSSIAPNVSTEDVSLALGLTSLEEHTLESSVVISSKTITSKFKQKLNSSMRYNPAEIEGVSDSNEKESISRQSKSVANTSTTSDTNPGTNMKLVTANSKNNNNKNINNNNNNNSKLSAKSSRVVTGIKSKVKPKCTEEDWIGKTPIAGGKQRKVAPKKMKNIAYDPDSDYEQSIKCKKVKRKLLENDIEANLKIEQLQSTLLNAEDSSMLLTTSRRKRNAGDMLYYWSSSSDEEIEKEEKTSRTKRHGEITKDTDRRRHCKPMNNNNAPVGKKRGRKKKQLESTKSVELIIEETNKQDVTDSEKDETKLKNTPLDQTISGTMETSAMTPAKKSRTNTTATDKKIGIAAKTKKQLETVKSLQIQTLPVQTEGETCGTSSEHLQQHGWIMGDSHKKLVTMLAHAKGKHDSRKQSTTNRKK